MVLAVAGELADRRRRSLRRGPWLALAAVLIVGITFGLVGLFNQPGSPTFAPAVRVVTILDAFAAARAGDTAAAAQLADDAVRLPLPDAPAPGVDTTIRQPRFTTLQLTIDPRGGALSAYQVRVRVTQGRAAVVGVEAGDGPAFGAQPPQFDRRVVDQPAAEQVVLAAFSTADAALLPSAPARVATIHLMTDAADDAPAPQFTATIEAAADATGHPLDATAQLQEAAP